MAQYRRKPIILEAFQLTNENIADSSLRPDWARDFSFPLLESGIVAPTTPGAVIVNCCMAASISDWIVRGISGEISPCPNDIFNLSYEPAETPDVV